MPYLELDGIQRELAAGDTTVGSDARAAWQVADPRLAGRHFVLRVLPDGTARVRPVMSENVVVADGAQVPAEGRELHDGSEIAAGGSCFTYTTQARKARPSRVMGASDAFLVSEFEPRAWRVGERLTLGRAADAAVHLRDPRVSRQHAELRSEAGEIVLHALGSSGMTLNGRRVGAPERLSDGDIIELPGGRFRFTRARPDAPLLGESEPSHREDEVTRRETVAMRAEDVRTPRQINYPGILAIVLIVLAVVLWLLER